MSWSIVRNRMLAGAVAVLAGGCAGEQPGPVASEVHVPLFAVGGNTAFNLGTHLRGEEEVFTPANPDDPTPADSPAQGEAVFRVSEDGSTVEFRLTASNIDNVIMAHIHCAAPGANGLIRMWLYPVIGTSGAAGPSGSGPHDGVLASGSFSPTGVTCPSGMPLLDAIRAGLTYVNVHTNNGVGGDIAGPGDFPGGEIRGQIDHPDKRNGG